MCEFLREKETMCFMMVCGSMVNHSESAADLRQVAIEYVYFPLLLDLCTMKL